MVKVEPRILYKPAFSVVGFSQPFLGWDGELDALWKKLESRYREIPLADPDIGFAVHTWTPSQKLYLAGMALRKVPGRGQAVSLPPGMTRLSFDPNAYAVFPHRGLVGGLSETLRMINRDWLPASRYRSAANYFFEVYDDRFQPGSDDSLLFVYVPVTLIARGS